MEKWELAYSDYLVGMKYKDIAEKYEVSINTVKSWKSRKWNAPPEKKGAHKTRKVAHKKKLQPVINNDDLTDAQKMFCLYYLQSFNATKAYRQAYPDASYNTAKTNGNLMLTKAHIKKELHHLKAELQQNVFVGVEDILKSYVDQYAADITDFITFGKREVEVTGMFGPIKDDKGNVLMKEVNYVDFFESGYVDGTVIKSVRMGKDGPVVELYDKQKAMTELLKYLDNNKGVSSSITIVDAWSDSDE